MTEVCKRGASERVGLSRGRQPRNCHVLLMEARPKATHRLRALTHSADIGSFNSLALPCFASTKMRMAGHMPPPLFSYLPLAALLALTSFSITAPACFAWTPLFPFWSLPTAASAADMHSSDLAKAAEHSHTFLWARNLKFNAQ